MAKLKPVKPVDPVASSLLMCDLSKARAMAWVLEQLGQAGFPNNLQSALEEGPENSRDWLNSVVGDALRASHDDIEREYRKLRGGIAAATTVGAIIRLVEGHREPKDGA